MATSGMNSAAMVPCASAETGVAAVSGSASMTASRRVDNIESWVTGEYRLDPTEILRTRQELYKSMVQRYLEDVTYDVLVFFSPLGIQSLYENFPNFKQNETRLAVFGKQTIAAVEARGLKVDITPDPPRVPSMTMALENYIQESNAEE